MALTQAQYLLMLAEDARAAGDQFAEEIRQKGAAHARQLLEASELIERARDIIEREKSRFGQYIPAQRQREEPPAQLPGATPPHARIMRKIATEGNQ